MATAGQAVLVTRTGDKLAIRNLRLADSHFSFDNSLLGRTKVPISSVKAIYQPTAKQSAKYLEQKCRELKFFSTTRDVLVITKKKDEKTLLNAEGALKAIGPIAASDNKTPPQTKVTFFYQKTDRKISVETVRAILLAGTAKKSGHLNITVGGQDGSLVRCSSLALDAENFLVDVPNIGLKKIPRKMVADITFSSALAVDLTSLKPLQVKEYGFFDKTFNYRVNQSVSGNPLRLNGKTHRSGLGLHSFCELTYKLDSKYIKFVAMVGINDSVHPAGDAELVILGDGKVIGKLIRLTGKDKAKMLRLDVSGIDKLTIRVGFGQDKLDVADHVDLASARLIKAGS